MIGYYKPVEILCEDNGRVVEGEVKAYASGQYMTVDMGGMDLNMQWDGKLQEFRASRVGLDFVAQPPTSY
jgi:hypothetical protein